MHETTSNWAKKKPQGRFSPKEQKLRRINKSAFQFLKKKTLPKYVTLVFMIKNAININFNQVLPLTNFKWHKFAQYLLELN